MQLKLFNFSKRRNSTKQPPTDYPATTVEVFLKKPTSVSEPTFIISGVNVISEAVNYCLWENRYYFVTDITYLNNDNCEIHCTIDVLATFKTQIGNYTAFVERSASSYDVLINDSYLTAQQDIITSVYEDTDLTILNGGCYLVRIAGRKGVNTYQFASLDQLQKIFVFTDTFSDGFQWSDTDDILSNITKAIFNPSKYILNVMYIPYSVSGEEEEIVVGYHPTGILRPKITATGVNSVYQLVKPVGTYTDFRKNNPNFTQISLYLPCVGNVSINPLEYSNSNLLLGVALDFATGSLMYRLTDNSTGRLIGTYEGQAGVNIQIGNSNIQGSTFMSLAGSTLGMLGGALAGGTMGKITTISSELDSISSINAMISPTPSIVGSQGNITKLIWNKARLNLYEIGSKDFITNVGGRPLYQNRKINTLSGFVKCGGASIELNAHSDERDKVNEFLNSGFYYE